MYVRYVDPVLHKEGNKLSIVDFGRFPAGFEVPSRVAFDGIRSFGDLQPSCTESKASARRKSSVKQTLIRY